MPHTTAQEHIAEPAGKAVQEACAFPLKSKGHIGKRAFDILFSVLIMVVVFPWLFPLLYLLIRLDSRGGAFFVQQRNGLDNKVFRCLKFRTMVRNKEADLISADESDVRITRVGKVLRVSGLDELPQLFNVLMGQMSIVGPRPHMISDNLKFEQFSQGYHYRNLVKPGITGLAQVKGYKGNANDARSIRKRTALDLEYVKHHNLLLDMKIILATARMMFTELFKMAGGK